MKLKLESFFIQSKSEKIAESTLSNISPKKLRKKFVNGDDKI